MNLTLEAFGGTSATQTNSTANARTAVAEYFVNFDQFDSRLSVFMSALASYAATPNQAPIIEAWASATEGDASGTGTLIGSVTLPTTAVGSLTGFDATLAVNNPGGEKYVVFTVRAGLNVATPVTLSFRGLLLALTAPDADFCPLATTTTLVKLRNGAKLLADKVNDLSVTDDTWNEWINQGVESLWGIVTTAYEDHFFKTFDFPLTGGPTGNYLDCTTIPAKDFRRVRLVERDPDTNARRKIRSFNFNEKDRRIGSYAGFPWCNVRRYRLMGMKVFIEPYEQAAGPYRLYYIPSHPKLTLTCDALDPAIDQWAEYPMVFAAMKALGVEESDDSPQARRFADLKGEILETSTNRADGDPDTVADVEGGNWGGIWG